MRNEIELRHQIAKNLLYYRKLNSFTQSDLAKKLNYSDKAISKWERGESIPDVYILLCLADLYGISLNDLTSSKPPVSKKEKNKTRALVIFSSIALVWVIATVGFILTIITNEEAYKPWLFFIYAIPVSLIVAIVFVSIWGSTTSLVISISLFAWSIPLTVCLTSSFNRLWFLFICVVPIQILIILWFRLRLSVKRIKFLQKTTFNND